VVRKKGYENLTELAILDQLRGQIANYKVPKQVIFAAELPRNTMGKVQKNALRQKCVAIV
jgi:malonyl-CoA/methylmalonyl-CoA synthetase